MEGVDHVDVLQVYRCRFIGNVDRMLERNVPDRESLELRVSGFASTDILVIQLGKAGCQLAAAAARSGNDDQRLCDLNVWIGSITLFAYDGVDIRRVTFGEPVGVGFDPAVFQLIDKLIDCR